MKTQIEIEVGVDGLGRNLMFYPADKLLRGRLDFHEVGKHEASAMQFIHAWPGGVIPGQRIRIDLTKGEAFIVEPLHEQEFSATRGRIERRGMRLDPAEARFALPTGDTRATWLYWSRRAVDDGDARLLDGEFPDTLPGIPTREFDARPVDAEADMIRKLVGIMWAKLSPAERQVAQELVGA